MELLAGDIAFDDDAKVELPFEERKRKFMSMTPRTNQVRLLLL